MFGTALSGNETKISRTFLTELEGLSGGDTLSSALVKLDNLRQLARDIKVQKFAFAKGDFGTEESQGRAKIKVKLKAAMGGYPEGQPGEIYPEEFDESIYEKM